MRYILILWALPLTLFWGWFLLSANDWHFGTIFLSRQLHDAVFLVYSEAIGVEPSALPAMLLWACVADTGLIGGIAALRWRAAWWPQTRLWLQRQWMIAIAVATARRNDTQLPEPELEEHAPPGAVSLSPYGPARPAE